MVDGSRMPRRVLHTSDLHLEKLNDKACHSLEAVVNLAIRTKVELVIIAGDFFDNNRVDDNLVRFAVEQLRQLPVYVAILPGNHDCLLPDSVYNRLELWKDTTRIRIFRAPQGETLDLPGLDISVWGKPIASYDGDFQPLVGTPRLQGNGQWHIAVAHGYYVSTEHPLFPSYHITHEEIVNSHQDYIALGHSPVFRCICSEPVKAYYCDSPTLSGAVALVDLTEEAGVQVTRSSL